MLCSTLQLRWQHCTLQTKLAQGLQLHRQAMRDVEYTGSIADHMCGSSIMVQDDGKSEGRVQRYRQAPACLEAAVDHWLQHAAELSFVLTLGDIIDGNVSPEKTDADLERVAGQIDRLVSGVLHTSRTGHGIPTAMVAASCASFPHLRVTQAGSLAVHHVVGNHCLAVGRLALLRRLAIEGDVAYRAVEIAPGWRLIILDTTVTRMADPSLRCLSGLSRAAMLLPATIRCCKLALLLPSGDERAQRLPC